MLNVRYITKDAISITADDYVFTEEDKKELWKNHNILYLNGVSVVWVEKRKMSAPLVHLMHEDDGQLFWSKERDFCFDAGWLDNYISTLTELKTRIGEVK